MTEQASCLMSAHEPAFMTEFFDDWHPEIRRMVRESKYDLCAACLDSRIYNPLPWMSRSEIDDALRQARRAIQDMEDEIERMAEDEAA